MKYARSIFYKMELGAGCFDDLSSSHVKHTLGRFDVGAVVMLVVGTISVLDTPTNSGGMDTRGTIYIFLNALMTRDCCQKPVYFTVTVRCAQYKAVLYVTAGGLCVATGDCFDLSGVSIWVAAGARVWGQTA